MIQKIGKWCTYISDGISGFVEFRCPKCKLWIVPADNIIASDHMHRFHGYSLDWMKYKDLLDYLIFAKTSKDLTPSLYCKIKRIYYTLKQGLTL